MIRKILDEKKELQKHLFTKGFLITNRKEKIKVSEFPFYSNWAHEEVENFNFYVHKEQLMTFVHLNDITFFLVGHAYNPFTMEIIEQNILEKVAKAYFRGEDEFFDSIDEITGLFILGYIQKNGISFLVDSSGFQSAVYGQIEKDFFLSSHAQLIGDVCNLKLSSFVKELTNYKWYNRVMGPYLPADLSPFEGVHRVVPNNSYRLANDIITHERFYPRKEIKTSTSTQEYMTTIKEAAEILKNSMILISEKWNDPQISLTGGIDSNTTFAAAFEKYDEYGTFSYISAEKESPDAEAAEVIANKFNVNHSTYVIPESEAELKDYNEIVEIIRHNNAYILNEKQNELRKRVFLMQNFSGDVEVKSWGSETIRGYWYKHFGRKRMPKLSGKLFRNLYKIFILNRELANKVDVIFEEYITEYNYHRTVDKIPPADLFFWEVTWGSWGGMNISEMRICNEITIPYNNRKFLDLMLTIPLESRISDKHHLDMKKYLNRELYDMNIRVINMHETKFRAAMLNVIFSINMLSPK